MTSSAAPIDQESPDLATLLEQCLTGLSDAPCLRFEQGPWWSGRQVAELAQSVTAELDGMDAQVGSRVAVVLGNSVEDACSLLGVLIGRRLVSAINPHTPVPRLLATLSAIDPAVVLLQSARAALVAPIMGALGVPVMVVSADGISRHGPLLSPVGMAFPGVAIELPTSGSTGTPKRVQIAQDQLIASFSSAGAAPRGDVRQQAGGVLTVPLCHIGGLWGLLFAVAAAQRTILLDKFTVLGFLAAVNDARPRAVGVPPAGVRMLLDAGISDDALAGLKVVTSGSARLDPEVADSFYRRFGVPVLSVYGATELAGAVAGWTLKDHRSWWMLKRESVGRAFPGCLLRVVDSDGVVLGSGQAGLLEVSSAQSVGGASLWTRTNDLARIDEDGFLYIDGRADDAIVRGGFKISPTIVQVALEAHPDVTEAVVVPQQDERLGEVPVAVVEVRDGAALDEGAVISWCRTRLLPYEVPTRILVVSDLPRGATMKVARADVLALFES